MANGKFSKPRSHFDEKPEASQTFDAYSGYSAPVPEENPEDLAIEQAFLDVSDEEPERDLPPVLDSILHFIGKNRKVVLVCSCIITLALLISIIAVLWFSTASDPYDGLILNNVMIADVNVGGMSRSEAEKALRAVTDDTFTKQDMVIKLPDTAIRLSPADTGAKLDVKSAVKAAYGYGRTGTPAEQQAAYEKSFTGNHTIGLLPYLGLDTEYIRSVLQEYADSFGSVYSETTYTLQGDMPELDAEKFDENAPCQTLVVTMGTPGLTLDIDTIFNDVLDAYSFNRFEVKVDEVSAAAVPEPLDLEALYKEFCIEPINASMDTQTFEPIPGVYGYGFDMEQAKKLLEQAEYGETVEIPMEYIEPEITEGNVLFRDVLGECQTPHTTNENRNTNLRLACEALNGVVLNPGETLSYNDTVGERTTAKGYKPAPAYSGTALVDSVGGGVCQVSSTLYYCTLLSDLEIVSRVNHGFTSSYIDPGMDATVNWGGPDFQFRNNTNYPIKIEAEVSDGYVKMRILGTDEKDYYVKMEYEITGHNMPGTTYVEYTSDSGYYDGQVLNGGTMGPIVKTFRCKYDKQTDELLSRDFETRSSYMATKKVVVKIVDGSTTTPETPDGETGGNTGGETGGNTGGETGGETGGNTGGETGGNTGGETGGNTGGETGGNTGGETGGNTGGETGGNTGGETGGGTTGGSTGGETGGNTGGDSGGSPPPADGTT